MLTLLTRFLVLLLVTAVVGYQSTLSAAIKDNTSVIIADSITVDREEPKSPRQQIVANNSTIFKPGVYCYQMRGDFIHQDVRLYVDASNHLTGDMRSASWDKYEGRFSKIDAWIEIDTDRLNAVITPYNLHDGRSWQTSWSVDSNILHMHSEASLDRTRCSNVNRLFDAERLTSSAYRIQSKEVKFEPGKYSTTVSDAVVRGDRDVYTVNAGANQIMHLIITSTENNAVFDVVSPDNDIMAVEQTKQSYLLPSSGEYQIIVGGTRGNAVYDLTVAIY